MRKIDPTRADEIVYRFKRTESYNQAKRILEARTVAVDVPTGWTEGRYRRKKKESSVGGSKPRRQCEREDMQKLRDDEEKLRKEKLRDAEEDASAIQPAGFALADASGIRSEAVKLGAVDEW